MIHKNLQMHACDACVPWKSTVKKDMPQFFEVILTRLFCILWYKNIQLTVFWNYEELFSRLMITFITISDYYFFLWCAFSLFSFLHIYTPGNKSVGNIYLLYFLFTHKIKNYWCQTKTRRLFGWLCCENLCSFYYYRILI